ncbi:MAG: Fic family protein [bacterium]
MLNLTDRQLKILEFVKNTNGAGNKQILEYLKDEKNNISRATTVRDINVLLDKGLIKKEGAGRNVKYFIKTGNPLLSFFDIEKYFAKAPDQREIPYERFNFDIFKNLKNIFTSDELLLMNNLTEKYRSRIKKISPVIFKKELERLTIELSWKSSQIEGNTYTLIDTEILLKEHKEAKGHPKEEAIMLLNHKNALEYILDKKSDFKRITLRKIENIHSLLIKNLNVEKGLRNIPVGITGTKYRPLDNGHQIREAVEKLIHTINKTSDPFTKTLIAMIMISYIQPFEDGNKRTSRLLGNALLFSHNICPLSFRSINEAEYKKAVILFYEQNSALYFKELFIEQFKFANENYFL